MSVVSLQKCAGYSPGAVQTAIAAALEPLGGIGAFVKRGETVLLKPNMLAPATPEQAVTTHPEVVRAVAQLVIGAGAKPFIADSPAAPGFGLTAKKSGIGEVAASLGVPIHELKDSVEYKGDDKKVFRLLEISRHALEADRIINLPKFKTHAQMYLTAGVKNTFGCVVGARKAQWHFKTGIDRIFFARMIVEVHHAVAPELTIIDGVLGMEGDGPGTGGTPRQIGLIGVSADAVALDRVLLEIAGGDFDHFFVMGAARDMGVGQTDLSRIDLKGEPWENFRQANFIFPKTSIPAAMGPRFVQKAMINHFTAKPREDRATCTLCNKCVEMCPTDVISERDKRLHFDYDKCIRCYCCVEVCPEGSMKPVKPFLLKMIS